MKFVRLWVLLAGCLAPAWADALVKYDEGSRVIEGVQLLQDADNPKVFYYLPQFPRLATKPDGETFEFLCVKYVGEQDAVSGGLLHALVEFKLPEDLEKRVTAELKKKVEGAELRGPVPLLQAAEDGAAGMGSFRVVSGTLSQSDGSFKSSVVTSGRAPLTPGSKAVVAALLDKPAATLLWETFGAPTSDVSVAISGYYEALVRGYNAKVSAETETIYKHFSQVRNVQYKYNKSELRGIVDDLARKGDLKVEVVDRSQSLEMDASAMKSLLDVVTLKLTDLMFSTEGGWTAAPQKEQAVEPGQIRQRVERGVIAQAFAGTGNQPYITDNQYVLKNRQDVQRNSFTINLAQSTTIRVPVDTAGNLGGVYEDFKDDPRYFRVVNLADPTFQRRTVQFQIDGNYLDSFDDLVNFVSVNFRKTYPDAPVMTQSLVFTHEAIQEGRTIQELEFPRLGIEGPGWEEFEYQVRWSVRDRPTVTVPPGEDRWIRSRDPAISLVPPFEKRSIEIEADRGLFAESGIVTAVVEFATPLAGKPKIQRKATLRESDPESAQVVSVYHDRDKPIAWRVIWHRRNGPIQDRPQGLTSDYLYLVPPAPTAEESQGR